MNSNSEEFSNLILKKQGTCKDGEYDIVFYINFVLHFSTVFTALCTASKPSASKNDELLNVTR